MTESRATVGCVETLVGGLVPGEGVGGVRQYLVGNLVPSAVRRRHGGGGGPKELRSMIGIRPVGPARRTTHPLMPLSALASP